VKASVGSAALILGTATTVSSGQYTKQLAALGIPEDEIFSQACPFLESEIQADPKSDLVTNLAEVYVGEAVEKTSTLPAGTTIQVGLCCSHYGYSMEAFNRAFKRHKSYRFELVNPNKAMTDLFKAVKLKNRVQRTSITVEVASKVKFTDQEIASISTALRPISVKTSEALKHYFHNENLFRTEN
jgi:glutamate racemase